VCRVMKTTLLLSGLAILVLTPDPGGASADVVILKGGERLGAPDSHLSLQSEGKVVVLDPKGDAIPISLDDVASIEFDGPRKIELNNGDVLHVTNMTLQDREFRFRSDLLGEIAVPLGAVVSISPPAVEETAKVPAPAEPQAPPAGGAGSAEPPKNWKGNIQFGYASTSGRQDTHNANLSAEAVRESQGTRWTLDAAARYGATDGKKNVDAQEASAKLDLFLSSRVYWYWDIGALRDSVNLIDFRLSPGLGVGRKFFTSKKVLLEGEIGITEMWERHILSSGEKESESELHARIASRFVWKLKPGSELMEEIEIFPGLTSDEELRYRSNSRLTAALTERLSLAAGFTVDYDGNPPQDVPKTSTNASTGFIYSF
jgi:putative salt-induced outer membrane protein YdiY